MTTSAHAAAPSGGAVRPNLDRPSGAGTRYMFLAVLAAAVLPTGTPKPNLQLDEQHQQWRPLFQASLAAFHVAAVRCALSMID